MKRAIPLSLCLIALAGCQSAGSRQAQLDIRPVDNSAGLPGGDLAIAAGKAQLARGNVIEAMASFRQALREPETLGEAHNGLGAAYAALGQHETALRHFERAAQAEPANLKFARNLARAHLKALNDNVLPGGDAKAQARAAADEEMQRLRSQFDAVLHIGDGQNIRQANTAVAVMTRLSPREISISTRPAQASGNDRGAATASAPVSVQPRLAAEYPIRIDLTKLPAR